MISLPPMGCLPAAITLFGAGNKSCVERLNNDAIMFNTKLENTTRLLMNRHSGLRLVAFNVYQPFLDIITNPTDNGTHLQNLVRGLYESSNPAFEVIAYNSFSLIVLARLYVGSLRVL